MVKIARLVQTLHAGDSQVDVHCAVSECETSADAWHGSCPMSTAMPGGRRQGGSDMKEGKTKQRCGKLMAALMAASMTIAWVQAASNLLSPKDTQFVTQAVQGGLAEVALGQLAVDRARNDMVRDFGARMVKEHGDTNAKLIELAKGKGFEPPTTLTAGHQQTLERLRSVDAEEFDREYVQVMVKDHRKDVAEFEKQSEQAEDPDLRRFAEQALPTLQSHLDAILDLEEIL